MIHICTVKKHKDLSMFYRYANFIFLHITLICFLFLLSEKQSCSQVPPVVSLPQNELVNASVLLKFPNSSGSGILFQDTSFVYLITAKHVIASLPKGPLHGKNLQVTSYFTVKDSIETTSFNIDLESAVENKGLILSDTRDIAVIKFGGVSKNTGRVGYASYVKRTSKASNLSCASFDKIKFYKQVETLTDIYIIGYPKSLGLQNYTQNYDQYDFDNPILRKGIVASKNLKNRTIILDCPVYPGNSGGPVMESRFDSQYFYLIGLVTQFIPKLEILQNPQSNTNQTFLVNSGYSVVEPMDEVINVIKQMNKQ